MLLVNFSANSRCHYINIKNKKMIFFLLLIIFGMLAIQISIRYNKVGKLANKLHGPGYLPIIGNAFSFSLSPPEKIWNYLRECANLYYPIGKIWYFTYPIIFVRHPDDLKPLLTCKTNLTKGHNYEYIEHYIRDGLITTSGEKWQHRRKLLTPVFHRSMFKLYSEISNKHIQKLITYIQDQNDETSQILFPLFEDLTLNITCESMLGIDLIFMDVDEQRKYREAMDGILQNVIYRTARPYIPNFIFKFLSMGKNLQSFSEDVHNFTNKVIQKRKEYYKKYGYQCSQSFDNNIDTVEAEKTHNGKPKSLIMLDLLLTVKKEGLIDDNGIMEEVKQFIASGYDTTAKSLAFTLLLLAENKNAQDLARAEAFRVLDQIGGKISNVKIEKFDYIERCIKESLRLFPSAGHITRKISKTIELKHGILPARSEAVICIFDLHRDPNFWTNPDKFDPDRFLLEHVQNRHPFAYIPFSAGPRGCIGQKFGMMILISTVAHILYNFYLEPVDSTENLQFKLSPVLSLTHPIHVKFKKLKK